MSTILDKTGGRTTGKPAVAGPRVCQYDSGDGVCGVCFEGIGRRKYCDEHNTKESLSRQSKYKASLSANFDEEGKHVDPSSVNIFLKHEHKRSERVMLNCGCCGNPYEVTLIPSMWIYPKYCEIHRNEYQRNRFLKLNNQSEN